MDVGCVFNTPPHIIHTNYYKNYGLGVLWWSISINHIWKFYLQSFAGLQQSQQLLVDDRWQNRCSCIVKQWQNIVKQCEHWETIIALWNNDRTLGNNDRTWKCTSNGCIVILLLLHLVYILLLGELYRMLCSEPEGRDKLNLKEHCIEARHRENLREDLILIVPYSVSTLICSFFYDKRA